MKIQTGKAAFVSAAVLALLAGSAMAMQPGDAPAKAPGQAPEEKSKASAAEPGAVKAIEPDKAIAAPKGGGVRVAAVHAAPVERYGDDGRRVITGEPTALAFKNVSVDQVIPFIVEATGKVVMPQQDVLNRKITVINDKKIPREEALNLVIWALQQVGVAVVESPTVISLRDIAEITRQDVPQIGPNESTLERRDIGNFAEKTYRLKSSTAKSMGEVIKGTLPDFAKMAVDEESNQITLMGNIGLLQRIELKIKGLDVASAQSLETRTFGLTYQDATVIKENIEELFSSKARTQGQQGGRNQNFNNFGRGDQGQPAAATSAEMRVTANTQQNSVTVAADPAILRQIEEQIKIWDREASIDQFQYKLYDLKYTDPVKLSSFLGTMFGNATGTSSTANRNQSQNQGQFGGFGQAQAAPVEAQGAKRFANQFTFTAMPDQGKLAVVAKTTDALKVLDSIIEKIDVPLTAGMPIIVDLKHASAEDLAEQLNALLAQDGTGTGIRRMASGLTENSTNSSPFAAEQNTASTTQQNGEDANNSSSATQIAFWWQRSRPPTDRRNSSNLIGLLRIVPVWRQNALMVVGPPEYRQAVVDLIQMLDKPGRQVLIAAIVAEVSREDATALGLRWSNQAINTTLPDNVFGVGTTFQGTNNSFADSLFNTSVLTSNVNLNVVLQALAQKTDVSILSEPKIFTSDNQEASFFDGQDIPFITDSQTNTSGDGTIQSFDYRAVGIQLRARPHITVQGDVDLKVNLELSSVVSGQTLFGGFIVNRRETTTQLIVKNKQTIVISGIMRSELTDIVRKVPLLADIPLVGYLFKSTEKTVKNSELLVFITPIVVTNTDDNDAMNEQYKDQVDYIKKTLRDSAPLKGSAPSPELDTPNPAPGAGEGQPVDPGSAPAKDQPVVPGSQVSSKP